LQGKPSRRIWRSSSVSSRITASSGSGGRTSEDLVLDKVGITRRTLTFLGLEPADRLVISEQTRTQGDLLNELWVDRYRELSAQRGL
jgi:hypothetical protein